ncbi:NAD(P)H-binding protein [Caballeronia sp. 15715]|uniref:NAD(P)H-binding protein n=1 Tax=unclassified Caballeronia TaxID=2646786 RepID=UPI0039E27CA1
MSLSLKRVLVTGATGTIGRAVLSQLDSQIQIRAFSRRATSGDYSAEIESMDGDLADVHALEKALVDVDTVFLLWPFLTVDAARPVIETIGSRAKKIVYLSTATAGDPEDRALNPISAAHYAIEQMIEETDAQWVIVRPTAFSSNPLLFWSGQIKSTQSVSWPFPNAKLSLIHESDVAAVVAKGILSDDLVGQKRVITGPESLSQKAELDIIGRELGLPLVYNELSKNQAREQMLSWGMPDAIVIGVLGYWERRTLTAEPVNNAVLDITGRPAQTFATWARENVQKFS